MVSVCFKAIQEQQEQIKQLQNEINQLKEMIKYSIPLIDSTSTGLGK